jgi:predicted nucleic acid-binding protein
MTTLSGLVLRKLQPGSDDVVRRIQGEQRGFSPVASYLLDTTALIDYLAGRQAVVDLVMKLAHRGYTLGVCCINIAELYSGLKEDERRQIDRLVDNLSYYEVTLEISKIAGSYRSSFARRGVALSIADTIVAATAIANQAVLITANIRDYPMEEIRILEQPR